MSRCRNESQLERAASVTTPFHCVFSFPFFSTFLSFPSASLLFCFLIAPSRNQSSVRGPSCSLSFSCSRKFQPMVKICAVESNSKPIAVPTPLPHERSGKRYFMKRESREVCNTTPLSVDAGG